MLVDYIFLLFLMADFLNIFIFQIYLVYIQYHIFYNYQHLIENVSCSQNKKPYFLKRQTFCINALTGLKSGLMVFMVNLTNLIYYSEAGF